MRSMVEGTLVQTEPGVRRQIPSTTPLRVAVPLPVPGRTM
jgi:hypothetical protein